ncbi:MAG TPA: hypothetical protein VKV95_22040 [Terriglobia bacterium]|nr:hypothetical protein [Terriglobia bacterium]
MTINFILMFGLIAAGGLGYAMFVAVRSYLRFYGTRLVTCPETKREAAVALDAAKVARESLLGDPHFRLSACSRWPERKDCGQECLGQIEKAPEDCLVKNIVGKWYAGKSCAYCQKPFESADDIFRHRPALMGTDLKSMEWDEIRPEELPETFRTALPICWSCHIAETFRYQHPDLVVDNPWQNRQGEWTHPVSDSKPPERRVV